MSNLLRVECNSVTPEMLNWMLPADKRRPFSKGKDKPWKYFVNANHPDLVELALVRARFLSFVDVFMYSLGRRSNGESI